MPRSKLAMKYPAKYIDIVRAFDTRYKNQLDEEVKNHVIIPFSSVKEAQAFRAKFNSFLSAIRYTAQQKLLVEHERKQYEELIGISMALTLSVRGQEVIIEDPRYGMSDEFSDEALASLASFEAKVNQAMLDKPSEEVKEAVSKAEIDSESEFTEGLPEYMRNALRGG